MSALYKVRFVTVVMLFVLRSFSLHSKEDIETLSARTRALHWSHGTANKELDPTPLSAGTETKPLPYGRTLTKLQTHETTLQKTDYPKRRARAPRVAIVIVIDQFSAHYIPKLRPFLKGGIGKLARDGVHFVNAFYDHALPATGPGHYLLSTGTYGSIHGIVSNKWYAKDGKEVACDDDTVKNGAVFKPGGGFYSYGKSARLSLVDTLSDQLIMHSYPHAHNTVWSLSLKSRSAIPMAGRLGKALWLDESTGLYTSSKAYFSLLPDWLKDFNKKLSARPRTVSWNLYHKPESPAYSFDFVNDYTHASLPGPLIGQQLLRKTKKFRVGLKNRDRKMNHGEPLEAYSATPQANKDLLDLALTVFEKNYTGKATDRFILWLGLSSLDKVGHAFGPRSLEALDMIYHMDAQLDDFMKKIYEHVDPQNIVFVLTADHGIQPIPEQLAKQGLDIARRYIDKDIITKINRIIELKYGITHFITHFKEPQLYVNQQTVELLADERRDAIYHDIKQYLLNLPGIRRAWTFDELQQASFADYDLDKYLARQLYKGRSGQIIFSVNPYTSVDKHAHGTSHITQYAYDTQIPLIFYQADRFIKKRITRNVYIPQVSITLATLFDVPRPSAATGQILPGLDT